MHVIERLVSLIIVFCASKCREARADNPAASKPRSVWQLQLRSAVDWNIGSRDPACPIGRQESNHVGNVLGLADSLQRLHSQRDLTSCFCLCKIRHIRVDYAGATAFTRMPRGPRMAAQFLTRVSIAPLVEA